MQRATALKTAIDLLHVPSQVRALRLRPLPDGVVLLIEIASGDEAAIIKASHVAERPQQIVHDAAIFFVEQILLSPCADSYRILGADQNANATELRHNMALLLKWLHPDHDHDDGRSIHAVRVTRAWEDLKTPQRRQQYNSSHSAHASQSADGHSQGGRNSGAPGTRNSRRPQQRTRRHRQLKRAGVMSAHPQRDQIIDPGLFRRIFRYLLGRPQF